MSSHLKSEWLIESRYTVLSHLAFGCQLLPDYVGDDERHLTDYFLQVSLNLCTMTACGFLNMGIVKAVASLASAEEQAQFIDRCKEFAHTKDPTAQPPHPTRTFKSYWAGRCERDWTLAFTTFTLGEPCLLREALT